MTEESNWILDRGQDLPAEEADIRPARQHAPVAREVTTHKQTGIIPQFGDMHGDRDESLSILVPAARPTIRGTNIQSAPVVPPPARRDAEIQNGPAHPPRSPISALAGRAAEENPRPFGQSEFRPSAEENQLAFGQTQSGLLGAATATRHNLSERVETASLAPLAAGHQTRMDHPVAPPLLPAKRRAIQPDFALPAQNPEPSIHVTIGRIEIRAEREGPSPRKNEKAASPVMGLEEYLRRKNTRGKE